MTRKQYERRMMELKVALAHGCDNKEMNKKMFKNRINGKDVKFGYVLSNGVKVISYDQAWESVLSHIKDIPAYDLLPVK